MAQEMKAMTLRLAVDQAAQLEQVAEIDEVPVSEAVREAIAEYIRKRRQDQKFRAKVQEKLESTQRLLEQLAD